MINYKWPHDRLFEWSSISAGRPWKSWPQEKNENWEVMVKCLLKIIIESQRRKRIFMKRCGIDPYSTDAFENLGKINKYFVWRKW